MSREGCQARCRGQRVRPPSVRRRLARRVRLGGDVGDQAAVVLTGTGDGEHRRFAHRRVAAQRRLDLPQLDAEAAHLDLVVAATQVVQLAARQPAHPVAGGVHPPPRLGGERVRQPALRGQPRAAQVAARQPGAGQVQLPRHPRRHRPQTAVEPVGPAAGQRPADLRLALAASDQPPGRVGGVLRRAVQVVQALDVVEPVHRVGEAARQRLAGQVHRHHRARHRAAAHQLGHRRRHRVDQRHRLPRRVPRQPEGVVRQHHPAAGRQRHEQLVDRQVEAHRGRRQHTRQLRRRVPRQGPPHHRHRAGVGDRDALGHAGRARGVDQVGQVGSMNRRALSPELAKDRRAGPGTGKPAPSTTASTRNTVPANARRQHPCRRLLHQRHRRRRVRQHEVEPLRRVGRVERYVGAARLQHAEDRRHQPRRALQAHRHPHLRTHPQPAQPLGHRRSPRDQLGVRPRLAVRPHQRFGRRRPRRLRQHQRRQRCGHGRRFLHRLRRSSVRRTHRRTGRCYLHRRYRRLVRRGNHRPDRTHRRLRAAVAPLVEQLPALLHGEQRQLLHRHLGALHRRRQQHPEVPRQALHRRRVEQVRPVAPRRGEAAVGRRSEGQREVELGAARDHRPRLGGEAGEPVVRAA